MQASKALIATCCLCAVLTGCKTIPVSEVSVTAPEIKVEGTTFDIFPLDYKKANAPETAVFESLVVAGLEKKGMHRVDATTTAPTYIFLFDYAVDMGSSFNYERRFVSLTYDPALQKPVQRLRLVSEGDSNKPMEVFPPIIKNAYSRFPASTGLTKIEVPAQ